MKCEVVLSTPFFLIQKIMISLWKFLIFFFGKKLHNDHQSQKGLQPCSNCGDSFTHSRVFLDVDSSRNAFKIIPNGRFVAAIHNLHLDFNRSREWIWTSVLCYSFQSVRGSLFLRKKMGWQGQGGKEEKKRKREKELITSWCMNTTGIHFCNYCAWWW